ncbi:DNA annealing helicase and endonuclease ZRANB3 isoform X1 [Rana temporaria]|uniref:DNA annealing helicase and endonuclease ZRANB3 isoform X1 n=1 Tax=Rana temporaria TaxID=8407 RepID=UPI001AADBD5E|nr:DNA annealing helicase and endonuclease ZRANB3 isoform X1 [Rana temporaria]
MAKTDKKQEKSVSPADVDERLSYLPEKLKERLMPFQKEGIVFALHREGRCMIADEMGLGKTIQAIAISYFYRNEWPLLIVVPSSLKYPWIEELEKWIPELGPEDITVIENKTDVGRIASCKVTVLGYGLLTSDATTLINALYKQHFRVVLVDESHYMKSRNASRSKLLQPIVQRATRALLLTGTPALGRPEELYMQIDALFPKLFGTWTDYAKKYCNAHVRYFGNRTQWDYRGASNLEDLHQRLSGIMIRRLKSEVLTQLPPKIRQRIPFDLPKDVAKEMNSSFEEWEKLMRCPQSMASESTNPFIQVMGLITRMYKQTALAKAGAVKDYIKMMLENDKLKFLVFAHHLSMLQACTEAAIENKARYIRIDGSVPSSERIHLVHQFQNDPDTRVAILSIQAAGQGLTFTAATHVVFAELYWDPGHINQAEDRAHRIGQSNSVHIHYLIAKGTMDTLMWGMLNRKAKVTGSTLNGKKDKMNAEEDDQEKWGFLSFAKSWTPNEELDDLKDQILFTHFEKEKQHDIRNFFSPNPASEKKRKRTEEDAETMELHEEHEEEPAVQEVSDVGTEVSVDTEVIDIDALFTDDDFEQQAKRFRPTGTQTLKSTPKTPRVGKRKSWSGKPSALFSSPKTRGLSEGTMSTPPRPPLSEKHWNCESCTYTNNALLPYCEICESPKSKKSTGSKNEAAAVPGVEEEKENQSRSDGDNEPVDCAQQESPPAPPSDLQGDRLPNIQNENLEGHPGENSTATEPEHCHSSTEFPAYDGLMFCASRHTDRIYLYSKDGEPLNCNFIPLDIKLENWDDLPEAMQQKPNRSLILRFVREWNSLTAMKQRLVRKSGLVFTSPVLATGEISKQQSAHTSTKRYLTKEDVAAASLRKVQSSGGSVRLVSRECTSSVKGKVSVGTAAGPPTRTQNAADGAQADGGDENAALQGYLQVLDDAGNPLCLHCQEPCPQAQDRTPAWDSRLCSQKCHDDFLIRSSQSYMRAKVFETEHGVCQQCCLNVHELYLSVRDAPRSQRKELLQSSWMAQLPLDQLNELIRNPSEGQFWQVDHIRPVYGGGGQCSLDNLQTLCTVCHRERTARQAKERSQIKKHSMASKYGSDITKFFSKV